MDFGEIPPLPVGGWNMLDDASPPAPVQKVSTLLLVEDNEEYAFLLSIRLKEAFPGVELTHARTTVEAVNLLSELKPTAILSDLMLPDSRGVDTIAVIREAAPSTPLVVISGTDDDSLALAAVKIGAQDYLLKSDISERMLRRSIRYAVERQHDKRALARLANHDVLTGLANRGLFQSRLMGALARSRDDGEERRDDRDAPMTVLMFLDLDNFKAVNDDFGHDAGDALLRSIADALRDAVRGNDLVARFGGDEFAVLLDNVENPRVPQQVANRILESIKSATIDTVGSVSTSIGIATIRSGETSADTAMKRADIALYQAKHGGRNQFRFFDESLHSRLRKRRRSVSALNKAIKEREFQFDYQPVNRTADGTVIGAEALIRWNDPSRGKVAPSAFIEIMEEEQLLNEISSWALNDICSTIAVWRELGWSGYVGANLSPRQFEDSQLVRLVDETLSAHSLTPACLQIEITENHLVGRSDTVINTLNGLRELGIKLSIDDFGTGYSSLSYLRNLPVSTLKIDRSFISSHETVDVPIVRSIIELAHALDFSVVAEGVETATQLKVLQNLFCDSFQGYYEARPMDATAFRDRYCPDV